MSAIPMLNLSEIGDVAVLTVLTPCLDATYEDSFKREVDLRLAEFIQGKILIDLECVRYLSSAPIGTLTALHMRTKKAGGRLVLCNINDQIRKVFTILKLDKVLTLESTLDSALGVLSS